MHRVVRDPALATALACLPIAIALGAFGFQLAARQGHGPWDRVLLIAAAVMLAVAVIAALAAYKGDSRDGPRMRVDIVPHPQFNWATSGNTRYYVATVYNYGDVTAVGCWPQFEFRRRWQRHIDMPSRPGMWLADMTFDGQPQRLVPKTILPRDDTNRIVLALKTDGGSHFEVPSGSADGQPPALRFALGSGSGEPWCADIHVRMIGENFVARRSRFRVTVFPAADWNGLKVEQWRWYTMLADLVSFLKRQLKRLLAAARAGCGRGLQTVAAQFKRRLRAVSWLWRRWIELKARLWRWTSRA